MMNLAFAQGAVITSGEVGILSKFLQTRKLERIDTPSDRICFKLEKNKPIIRIANGTVHEFPVRRSMVDKLLKWHHINSWTLNKASNETTISLLNDLLLSIKSTNVRIYLEDGDAKTITSSRYTEFMDDDVLNACDNLLIRKVSRTDKVLRIDSHITARFQPVVGDDCGFGFTIFNSETGFHSLQVYHYILRYVCSNGLIMQIPSGEVNSNGMIHYNFNPESLKVFLEEQMKNIQKTQGLIAKKLMQAAETAPTNQSRMHAMRLLKRIRGNADAIKEEVKGAATEWELVNIVTAHAREQPVDIRLLMEQSAARLLN